MQKYCIRISEGWQENPADHMAHKILPKGFYEQEKCDKINEVCGRREDRGAGQGGGWRPDDGPVRCMICTENAILNEGEDFIIMKKRMIMAMFALAAVMLAGCGGAEDTGEAAGTEAVAETESGEEGSSSENTQGDASGYGDGAYVDGIDVAEYVTLGEYKGIEVSLEDYIDQYIQYSLQVNPAYEYITDRAVETGDIVNIDYEGKIDGVAFDGGTAQGTDLQIGSGTFIPGFEEGLIGAKDGETLDVDVTFPEDYRGTDVAGKDAVFTITVNSIRVEKEAELTDEFVQGLGLDCETVEEYRKYIYDEAMETEAPILMLQNILENSQIKDPPEAMVNRYYDRLLSDMSYRAMMYGYDLETFMTLSNTSEEQCMEAAREAAREIMVMKAIADAEGLVVTDEEMESEFAKDAEEMGYEDVEEYKEALDAKAYREYLLSDQIMEYLLKNGTVKALES